MPRYRKTTSRLFLGALVGYGIYRAYERGNEALQRYQEAILTDEADEQVNALKDSPKLISDLEEILGRPLHEVADGEIVDAINQIITNLEDVPEPNVGTTDPLRLPPVLDIEEIPEPNVGVFYERIDQDTADTIAEGVTNRGRPVSEDMLIPEPYSDHDAEFFDNEHVPGDPIH